MSRVENDARHAVFAPVDTVARVDAVVRRLGDAIELGLLADGEQLPGESELSTRLGVSTVTLREALMALRQQGLVTTRRGRGGGSFVVSPAKPLSERLFLRLADWSTPDLRDLADHWAAITGAAARLAAQRTEPEDLAPLHRSVDALAAATEPAARARIHARFHVELAAAAQSARLTREEIRFQAEIGTLLCLALTEEEDHTRTVTLQRTLIGAVRDGAGDRAGTLAEECVQDAMARLIGLRLGIAG
ncbi:GntR family transcriptional regulator [Streptomyces sp. MTZ3.1]|uniref:GntR family transcriptional regulator n=1 Tax=Streptomyces meridianus TaxID=2938945 RepID=A0ABT0XC34_9ACTN|nr:GntR family transcriptional regulator [Streptomyces meridianus]MCM2580088.1 GntR family transcriptional regulator [Streptomyces meridianus]